MRNYKKERKYDSQPIVKKKRANRNKARYDLMKKGIVRKGDGKDVHHRNGNPKDNSRKNLAITAIKTNRSFPRTSKARKK